METREWARFTGRVLTSTQALVLREIAEWVQPDGICRPVTIQMLRRLPISESHLRATVSQLIGMGLIYRVQRGRRGHPATYRLAIDHVIYVEVPGAARRAIGPPSRAIDHDDSVCDGAPDDQVSRWISCGGDASRSRRSVIRWMRGAGVEPTEPWRRYIERQERHAATRSDIRSVAGVIIVALRDLARQGPLVATPPYDIIEASRADRPRGPARTPIGPVSDAADIEAIDKALRATWPDIYDRQEDI